MSMKTLSIGMHSDIGGKFSRRWMPFINILNPQIKYSVLQPQVFWKRNR
jgi:hypothetical protein